MDKPFRVPQFDEYKDSPFVKKYGLSLALFALFAVSFALQTWMGWRAFSQEELAHGQVPEIGNYVWHWGEATFENWQSEFLQLLTFVTLTSALIHVGSHESKDGQDRMEKKIDHLMTMLNAMNKDGERHYITQEGVRKAAVRPILAEGDD